ASPKLLLAHMVDRERDEYLARARKIDPDLRRRPGPFAEELATIVRQGWSESSEEITPDIWAAAAPVAEGTRLAAALSVAGPAFRLTERQRTRIIALTRRAADDISQKLAAIGR
ncbi:MAG: hypothetical protein INH10_19860, partial [Rhodocyclaceae bacterium]|nr:hypothetical protein [Rhodocyclaceae bacterium]